MRMWRNWQTRMVEGHVILDRGGSNPFIRTKLKTAPIVVLFFNMHVRGNGNTKPHAISQENSMRFEADQFFADAGVLQAHRGGK